MTENLLAVFCESIKRAGITNMNYVEHYLKVFYPDLSEEEINEAADEWRAEYEKHGKKAFRDFDPAEFRMNYMDEDINEVYEEQDEDGYFNLRMATLDTLHELHFYGGSCPGQFSVDGDISTDMVSKIWNTVLECAKERERICEEYWDSEADKDEEARNHRLEQFDRMISERHKKED